MKIIKWIFDREWWAVRFGTLGITVDYADGKEYTIVVRRWFGRLYVVKEAQCDA